MASEDEEEKTVVISRLLFQPNWLNRFDRWQNHSNKSIQLLISDVLTPIECCFFFRQSRVTRYFRGEDPVRNDAHFCGRWSRFGYISSGSTDSRTDRLHRPGRLRLHPPSRTPRFNSHINILLFSSEIFKRAAIARQSLISIFHLHPNNVRSFSTRLGIFYLSQLSFLSAALKGHVVSCTSS